MDHGRNGSRARTAMLKVRCTTEDMERWRAAFEMFRQHATKRASDSASKGLYSEPYYKLSKLARMEFSAWVRMRLDETPAAGETYTTAKPLRDRVLEALKVGAMTDAELGDALDAPRASVRRARASAGKRIMQKGRRPWDHSAMWGLSGKAAAGR